MNVQHYRKKPVVIEAVQYHGGNDGEIQKWTADHGTYTHTEIAPSGQHCLIIPTLEGDHAATLGDWIIKGVQGEFYPCKPDIFQMTYELAPTPRLVGGNAEQQHGQAVPTKSAATASRAAPPGPAPCAQSPQGRAGAPLEPRASRK